MGSFIGSICCGVCCNACGECEGQKYGFISRIPYIFLFLIAGIFSIIMSLYGTTALDLEFYTGSICNSSTCSGNGSVYRVSFLLFIFELIHVFIIGCGVISFHWLWFMIKFIIFIAILTLTFVIGDSENSNAFFQGYADYFARFISGFYLLLQILIFISYGYKINEYLQEKGNDMNADYIIRSSQSNESKRLKSIDSETRNNSCNKYFMILGLTTFGLYIISLTLCGLFFQWYASDKSCDLHKTLISLTIIMILLNFLISAIRGDGSLFVSSIVSFYITFLCFSGLQVSINKTCNIFANYRNSVSLWIGFILAFICIFYFALIADRINVLWETNNNEYIVMDNNSNFSMEMSISDQFDNKNTKQQKDSKKNENDNALSHDIVDDREICVKSDVSNEEKDSNNIPSKKTQRISNSYFHFILTLSACYFAMLLTDWGVGTLQSGAGKQSMIVNITTQYVIILLFWWTLLAPVICPSRFKQRESL